MGSRASRYRKANAGFTLDAALRAPHSGRTTSSAGEEQGDARVFLTERGASFGDRNLVVDMRSLAIMREYAPVVFDATHSVQMPSVSSVGDGVATSGGQPQFIPVLARAAAAAGVDGLFLEAHDNPAQAKSDGANALRLDGLKGVLEQLLAVHEAVAGTV